ncbi:Crp/Fnr family transcriptional regulator [Methylobacterium sp.]|uniref:Crp/Fnr family transcriptional regulator n=1 Tax=Methylobacterium sp. TaxID=409 RepID=UPI002633FB36|nr:Crp/Fnr family transcriptional regulator [Methylobacterium sp.]MDB5647062.1 CarD family transcriptional regulator [Methylobacterium sp.]
MSVPSQRYVRNQLLGILDGNDYDAVRAVVEPIVLSRWDVLIPANQPITHAYFLECGIASEVATTPEGRRIEVCITGPEGLVGVPLLLDVDRTPHETFVQIEGEALRVECDAFRSLIETRDSLRRVFAHYAYVAHLQTADTALSNGSHTLEERLARWLLMCHDRIEGDEFPVTHEFLSTMLGVRRPGVTTAIHNLEGGGAIKARRSHIQVLDREKLNAAAGDSYGVPEREYRRLINATR